MLVTDAALKDADVIQLGCYVDREKDPDLPIVGPMEATPITCMLSFCRPKVIIIIIIIIYLLI